MNEELQIVAVCRDEYDFTSKDSKHLSGTSHKVCIAYYRGGAEVPFRLEIIKTTESEYKKAAAAVGKRCRGSVLYDRFGRFAGIG